VDTGAVCPSFYFFVVQLLTLGYSLIAQTQKRLRRYAYYEENQLKYNHFLTNKDSGSLPDDIDLSDSTDGSDDDNFETTVPLIEDRNEQKADFGSGSGSLSGSGTSDGK